MSNPLNLIPGVSTLFTGIKGLISTIDRKVNSSEHNFKNDLNKVLERIIGPEAAKKVKDFLNTGKDEGLGDRLRALMSSGVIPPGMAPQIAQLANRNGVPARSIDPNALQRPMDDLEAAHTIGDDQAKKLGISDLYQRAINAHEVSHQRYKELRLQGMHPN